MLFVFSSGSSDDKDEKFNKLYTKYYGYAYTIAKNILYDKSYVDDMVHDIFYNIWNNIDKIDADDELGAKAWISVIAKNTTINKYNKDKKISPKIAQIDNDTLYATVAERSANPCDIVVNDDNVEYIYRQIGKLGKKYSDVMLLKYKYDHTPEEIAEMLGMNVKTVYTRLTRGRDLLKTKMVDKERGTKDEEHAGQKR